MGTRVAAVVGLTAFAFSGAASAATLCVKPGGTGGCYPTITDAVASAVAGDQIKIGAGTYPEVVTIPAGKGGLTLSGSGGTKTIIDPAGLFPGLTINAGNVTVTNLGVNDSQAESIQVNANNVTLRKLSLFIADGDCVTATGANLRVESSRMEDCSGMTVAGNGAAIVGNRWLTSFLVEVTGDSALIERNLAETDGAIFAIVGNNGAILRNRLLGEGEGLFIDGNHGLLQGNRVLGSSDGIGVLNGNHPRVLGNRIAQEGSSSTGIFAICPGACSGTLISGNRLDGEGDFSFDIGSQLADDGGQIIGNVTRLPNSSTAFYFDNDGDSVIERNTALGQEFGFFIESASTGVHTLRSNRARETDSFGFGFDTPGHLLDKNNASNGLGNGIVLGPNADNVILTNNKASNNGEIGIVNLGGSLAVIGNTAKNNLTADYCGPTPPGKNSFGTILDPCI